MPRTNEEIEALFDEWSDLLQIQGTDAFRVRAYERAARAVGGHPQDVAALDLKGLQAIPAVGKNMAARIHEYVQTGRMAELDDLRALVPPGLRDLMRVPGMGPKKAVLVYEELGVASIQDLSDAVEAGRLRDIKGLGAKTEENLRRSIRTLAEHGDRVLVDVAIRLAERVIGALRDRAGEIAYAGSLRRFRETIGDVDVLATAADSGPVMDAFVGLPFVERVLAKGETKSSVVTEQGLQVDLRVVPAEAWGAALIYFTGSKAHNIKIREIAVKKGLKLSEYGLFESRTGRRVAAATETEVYDALGLPWIEPTMREDTGEVEAALDGRVPRPVSLEDIRGDLHTHTDLSDGTRPLAEMVARAAGRGYTYYAVTDHGEDLKVAGVAREALLAQRKKIATLRRKHPTLEILHGCELNIDASGGVDYDPEFLAGFDFVVASVHSHFDQAREKMTARIVRAMENPFVNVIGHPTARLIGKRSGIDADIGAIAEAAARTGTALEVNALPHRLDLRDEHVRWAVDRGATIAISTDAHSPDHLDQMRFGVATAQRGWLTKEQTLNARSADEIRAFVAAKR